MENKALTVLLVCKNFQLGGSQKQIILLANGLLKNGFKPIICVFKNTGELKIELNQNIEIYELENFVPDKPNKTISTIIATVKLLRLIYKTRPDIIYSRHWQTKIPSSIAGRITKTKTVLVDVNNPLEEMYKKKSKIISYILRRCSYNLSKNVIAVSKDLSSEVKKYYKLNFNVDTIYNCIDLDYIKEKSSETVEHHWFNDPTPIIVSIGRLVPQKGFEYLIKAIKIVNNSMQVRLLLIGDGNEKKSIINLSKELLIEDKVDLIGFKSNPYPYLKNADLFVLSSNFEGFGIVLIEAMAVGLPVISTDCEYGPKEIINDYQNGILVSKKSPEIIADKIIEILKNDELRSNLSKYAIERSKYFSRDKMVKRYVEYFNALCVD